MYYCSKPGMSKGHYLSVELRLTIQVPLLGTRGFSRVRGKFSVLAEGRSHERRSTETGNRARKVSGTQGTFLSKMFHKRVWTTGRRLPV